MLKFIASLVAANRDLLPTNPTRTMRQAAGAEHKVSLGLDNTRPAITLESLDKGR